MDRIAERLVGKELRQIHHRTKYDAVLVFEDGAITAWTEVKVNVSFGNSPLIAQEVKRSNETATFLADTAPRCAFAKTAARSCQLERPFYLNVGGSMGGGPANE